MKYYRMIKRSGVEYPRVVVDAEGEIFAPLSQWAVQLQTDFPSDNTVRSYLGLGVEFVNFVRVTAQVTKQKLTWKSPPKKIRALFEAALYAKLRVKGGRRFDGPGRMFHIEQRKRSTAINMRTGIKSFYDCMISRGMYRGENPIARDPSSVSSEQLAVARKVWDRIRGRQRNPKAPWRRHESNNFFVFSANKWCPKPIIDPHLYRILLEAVRIRRFRLREESVLGASLDSGCRIHEICGMTIRGWLLGSCYGSKVRLMNKGSGTALVKDINLTDRTRDMFWRYADTERISLPNEKSMTFRDIAEMGPDATGSFLDNPFFTTKRGGSLCPKMYRDHYFKPQFEAAGIRISPHQLRHYFVTMNVMAIRLKAKDPREEERAMQCLIRLMDWTCGEEMLALYNHALDSMQNDVHVVNLMTNLAKGHTEADFPQYATPKRIPANLAAMMRRLDD